MKGRTLALRALFAVAAIGLALWLAADYLIVNVPGMIQRRLNPVAESRDITWEEGPRLLIVPAADRPPNIVVILVDDLGWNDLTWNGGGVAGGTVPTPNIDSIAQQGVQLTAGYAGNATCAPSRAAIMTGRYPTRFGFEFTPAPMTFMKMIARFNSKQPDRLRKAVYFDEREADVPPMSEEGVPPEEITLAELLGEKGYRTLMLGKWHLGSATAMRPEAQGFDEFVGFDSGASLFGDPRDPGIVNSKQDFDPIDQFLWANLSFAVRRTGIEERFRPDEYMTDYLSTQAVRAIAANQGRPFFLYLAYNAPHTPLQATKADYDALPDIEDHTLRVYGAMIRALDRGVGRVLDALREHGLEENTLVVFTSDNGGANYVGLPDLNKPYRGWKMTFFEGGLHSPFFIKWPAVIEPGTTFDQPVAHIDVFATAAAAAGAALPDDRPIDGVDLVPYLTGAAEGRPHEALFWRSGHYQTVRAGDWKLQVSERPPKTWLFDLAEDPTEQRNVADRHPEMVDALRVLLDGYNAEVAEPAWPALIEGPITIDIPLNVPESPDDEHVFWAN